jgi:hypothetical protein
MIFPLGVIDRVDKTKRATSICSLAIELISFIACHSRCCGDVALG